MSDYMYELLEFIVRAICYVFDIAFYAFATGVTIIVIAAMTMFLPVYLVAWIFEKAKKKGVK